MDWNGYDRRTELTVSGVRQLLISPDRKYAYALGGGGPQAYLVTLPGVSGISVSVANPAGAAVLVKKLTTIGAMFPAWSHDSGSLHYSLGRSFFTHDVAAEDSAATARTDIVLRVPADKPRGTIVLRGARILTMNGREVIERGDIVVTDNRIVAVGTSGSVDIPPGARTINVSGKTILPGYVDSHGHVGGFGRGEVMRDRDWNFMINLAYGITTIRDPSTGTDVFGYSDLLRAGEMIGSRLYATGPVLSGGNNITSLDAARDVITRYADFYNTRYIKQYGAGERRVLQWLLQAAAEKEVTAVTEPYYDVKKDVNDALDGYPEMGHGWPIYPVYRDLTQLLVQTGQVHTATLTTTFGGPKGRTYFFTRKDFHDDPKLRRFMPHADVDRAALPPIELVRRRAVHLRPARGGDPRHDRSRGEGRHGRPRGLRRTRIPLGAGDARDGGRPRVGDPESRDDQRGRGDRVRPRHRIDRGGEAGGPSGARPESARRHPQHARHPLRDEERAALRGRFAEGDLAEGEGRAGALVVVGLAALDGPHADPVFRGQIELTGCVSHQHLQMAKNREVPTASAGFPAATPATRSRGP